MTKAVRGRGDYEWKRSVRGVRNSGKSYAEAVTDRTHQCMHEPLGQSLAQTRTVCVKVCTLLSSHCKKLLPAHDVTIALCWIFASRILVSRALASLV